MGKLGEEEEEEVQPPTDRKIEQTNSRSDLEER